MVLASLHTDSAMARIFNPTIRFWSKDGGEWVRKLDDVATVAGGHQVAKVESIAKKVFVDAIDEVAKGRLYLLYETVWLSGTRRSARPIDSSLVHDVLRWGNPNRDEFAFEVVLVMEVAAGPQPSTQPAVVTKATDPPDDEAAAGPQPPAQPAAVAKAIEPPNVEAAAGPQPPTQPAAMADVIDLTADSNNDQAAAGPQPTTHPVLVIDLTADSRDGQPTADQPTAAQQDDGAVADVQSLTSALSIEEVKKPAPAPAAKAPEAKKRARASSQTPSEDSQQPARKKSVAEAKDDDGGADNVADGGLDDVLSEPSPAYNYLTDAVWLGLCGLFMWDPQQRRGDMVWCHQKRTMPVAQVHAVYLMMWLEAVWQGGVLGDGMGMGKTCEQLAKNGLMAMVEFCHRHVEENAAQHGPASGQGRCRWAMSVGLPILCPCEAGFPDWLRQWHQHGRPRGLTLAIVPSHLVATWVDEFEATFHLTNPVGVEYRLLVGHASATIKRNSRARRVTDLSPAELARYRASSKVDARGLDGQSAVTVVSTPQSFIRQGILPLVGVRPSNASAHDTMVYTKLWERDFVRNQGIRHNVRFARVVVDEIHNYRDLASVLARCLLHDAKDHPLAQSVVQGMTGTPYERGPHDMRLMIALMRTRWERFPALEPHLPPGEADKRRTVDDGKLAAIDAKIRAVKAMQRKAYHDGTLTRDVCAANEAKMRDLKADMDRIISAFIVQRNPDTIWYDKEVLEVLPPLTHSDVDCLPEPGTPYYDRLTRMSKASAADLQAEARQDVAQGVAASQQLRNWLEPVFSIPAFLSMLQGVDDAGQPIAKLPGLTLTALLGHRDFEGIVRGRSDNYFATHAKMIWDSSPKIKLLYKMAREQTSQTETQTMVLAGAAPASRLGQVVAWTEYPVVCHAVTEALRWRARQDAGKYLRPFTVRCLVGEHSQAQRSELLQAFGEGKVQVLLSTRRIVSEGLTMTRATLIVGLEPPWTATAGLQCPKRIHRKGQTYDCRSVTIKNSQFPAEQVRVLEMGLTRAMH